MSDELINKSADESTPNTRNLILFLAGMALLGVLLALVLFGGELFGPAEQTAEPAAAAEFEVSEPAVNDVPSSPPVSNVEVGDTAPDFALADLEGNVVKLSELRGRPVIINFWASWCAPCRIEMPELQETFEAHQSDSLAILAVNREEDPETVQGYFYDEMGLTFTPLLDQSAAVAEDYGVFNMPTSFFVNAEGEVTVIHRGPMPKSLIEDYLSQTIQ